jgi:hypothetical protein
MKTPIFGINAEGIKKYSLAGSYTLIAFRAYE